MELTARFMFCTEDGKLEIVNLNKGKSEKKIQLAAPIAHMALFDPKDGQLKVALGGKDNALQVWDLQSNQMIWKSKNVHENIDQID